MIYPRLRLARNLLASDGLMVAQISDVELHNFRRVLDEIFGEENYVNTIAIQTKVGAGASGGGEDKRLKKNVEYILVYARSFEAMPGFANNYVDTPLVQVISEMKDAGESWKYTSVIVDYGVKKKVATVPDGDGNPIDVFLCEGVKRSTLKERCREEGLSEEQAYLKYLDSLFSDTNAQTSIRTRVIQATDPLKDGQMYAVEYVPTSGREKGKRVCHYYISPTVRRVIWLKDVAFEKNGVVIKRERTGTLWNDIDYNNIGREGDVAFSNGKKPIELIKRILRLSPETTGLVLDFFAGSGTTAHAVLSQNLEDGGSRRFVMVQLPEVLSKSNDGQSDAVDFCESIGKPHTVVELTKERLRRSAAKIKDSSSLLESDTGFRVFKLDISNIRVWNPNLENITQSLLDHHEHVLDGRTEADITYELLLKLGLDLCVPMETRTVAGKSVEAVGGGVLMLCLAEKLAAAEVEAVAAGIVAWHKELAPAGDSTVVFRDSAFDGDVAKTNMAAILAQNGLENVRSL
jgi:adenine-specific DNA-methyltransferase